MRLRPTELIVIADAIRNNVGAIQRRLSGRAKMMAVVKADAYGHGILEVARLSIEGGASMLGVAIAEEGIALREAGISAPILVMGGASEAAARASVNYGLSQAVFDLRTLSLIEEEAARLNTRAKIHLAIDTGMTRVGILGDSTLLKVFEKLRDCPHVEVEGAYTHFADPVNDKPFTAFQNEAFIRALSMIRGEGHRPIAHAAASGAMLADESLWHDMVRPGVAIYGASVRDLCTELMPAQQLVTRPVRIERVPAGTTVSYDRTFTAERESLIMTLPIGYGDGYPRILSGRSFALVRGRRAPIAGLVCMDMIMLDVTDIQGVSMEDEVVLMGCQGGERITPDELSGLAMTNAYEIMLGFAARVPRRVRGL